MHGEIEAGADLLLYLVTYSSTHSFATGIGSF